MAVVAEIEPQGRRIFLSGALRSEVEILPGGRWRANLGVGSFPLTMDACFALRQAFGSKLELGDRLSAWGWAELRRREAITSAMASESCELPRLAAAAPRLEAALEPHQRAGIAAMVRARRILLADEPGLGKTVQLIGACLEADFQGPILVVAPQIALSLTWTEELARWAPKEVVYAATGARARKERILAQALAAEGRRWVLVNPEMLSSAGSPTKLVRRVGFRGRYYLYPEIHHQLWSAVLADEAHLHLITSTPLLHRQTQARAGLTLLRIEPNGFRIPATGTPMRGQLSKLWGTLNWMDAMSHASYRQWTDTYFLKTAQIFGPPKVGKLRRRMRKQFYENLDSVMIRRTKGEVSDLAPIQEMGRRLDPDDPGSPYGVWLPMTSEQRSTYRQLTRDAAARLPDGNLLIAQGVLDELTRLKLAAVAATRIEGERALPALPSNKIAWLLQFLADRGIDPRDPGGTVKVIVASQFTTVIELIQETLTKAGIDSVSITGKVSKAQAKEAKRRFQEQGGPRVILLNTRAGGVSLNLQRADDIVLMDETWIDDDQEQVINRAHRMDRGLDRPPVTVWRLKSLGTVEELHDPEALHEIRRAMDGRRKIKFARKWLAL